MYSIRLTGLVTAVALGLSVPVAAQAPRPEQPGFESRPAEQAPPDRPAEVFERLDRFGPPRSDILRIGQDYTLMPGESTAQVAVIAGNATIEGHVDHDVIVILGRARLASTASIDGSLVIVGGEGATVEAGARVARDLVIVGGILDAPRQFTSGGGQVVIGPLLGGSLEGLVPWISRGLFWGRPIVPNLPWVWLVVGGFFVVYLLLSLLFHKPVRASVDTLAERPLTSFVVGLLVLLLVGPVCLLLTLSIAGIAVVPFVLCALLLAWLLGKVGVIQWVGTSVFRQDASDSRPQSLRSFAIGFALICLAYMVPLLGAIAWTTVGVFGLGGATLAFVAAYRRESPPAPPRAAVVPPVVQPQPLPRPVSEAAPQPALPEIEPAPGSDVLSFPHASFRDRLAAFVLDVILVVISHQILDFSARRVSVFLLLLVYHVGFWAWKGTTVGGIICQLRVVRVDGARLGFADALVRGLASIFSLAVVGLGGLWILKDPERQGWHDKIAGTYVVKVPRNWPT